MHLSKMPLRISRYLFHRTSEYRFQYFPTRRQFQCLEKPNLVRSDIVSFVECISQRCLYAYRGIYSTEHQSIDSNTFQPDANFSVLKSRISSDLTSYPSLNASLKDASTHIEVSIPQNIRVSIPILSNQTPISVS